MIHLTVQQLSAALDGALTGPSLELVVRHLAACHDCRDRQARLAKHDDALRRLLAQDPGEAFMDDLSKRAEAWVLAIARGMPEPMPQASVPLPHEEDPASPVEPPPPPPRPELGRAGELASEAGWGRIGIKPTASTNAPDSDPEEAQRLMEALERGDMADFTELTAQGMREHTPVDGPVFDLPAWLKEQSRRAAEPREGPREVPKVNVYFEKLDERAAGLPPAAVHEVFRRDDSADTPNDATPQVLDTTELPPGHAKFAPPGLRLPVPSSAPNLTLVEASHHEHAEHAERLPASGLTLETSEPRTAFVPMSWPPASSEESTPLMARKRRKPDRAFVVALTSICGLGLVLLALQLTPAGPPTKGGLALPEVRFRPNDVSPESGVPVRTNEVRTAATRAAIEQVIPPVVASEPDSTMPPSPQASGPIPGIPPVIEPETTSVDEKGADPVPSPRPVSKPAASKPVEPRSDTVRPAEMRSSTVTASAQSPTATVVSTVLSPKDDADWPLLCGVVVDANGTPVAGARITVTEIAFSMRTDAKGRFCLSAPAGTQHLLVEAAGFAQTREAVQIRAGQPELRLTLAH